MITYANAGGGGMVKCVLTPLVYFSGYKMLKKSLFINEQIC